VNFLLALIELFSLGVTAEALRTKIDKRNISAKSVHLASLCPTASTSTNDHLTVLRHYVCT